jgi:IPT/TIG domain
MAIPTITSITPAAGLTSGRTFVTLVGTQMRLPPAPPPSGPTSGILPVTVEVLFGGRRATKVSVRDDPANPPDGTIVTCLSPPQTPATVDIVLRNLDDGGAPIAGEEVIAAGAFTYLRTDLTQESELTRLVRTLLRALKAQVLENLSLTVHTDFDDTTGDQLHVAAVSKLPALVIIGPELDENRFYSLNALSEAGGGDAVGLPFSVRRVPYTVDLTFQLIGMSEHTIELLNLMHAATSFFHKNKTLEMDRDPSDLALGRVAYEMDFVAGGQLKVESRPNESNVRHFTGTFVVRGFDLDEPDGVVIDEGRTNQPVAATTEQTGVP